MLLDITNYSICTIWYLLSKILFTILIFDGILMSLRYTLLLLNMILHTIYIWYYIIDGPVASRNRCVEHVHQPHCFCALGWKPKYLHLRKCRIGRGLLKIKNQHFSLSFLHSQPILSTGSGGGSLGLCSLCSPSQYFMKGDSPLVQIHLLKNILLISH